MTDSLNERIERRQTGWYWVRKETNASAYTDLDPWLIAMWDEYAKCWYTSGSMSLYGDDHWTEIKEQRLANELLSEVETLRKEKEGLEWARTSITELNQTLMNDICTLNEQKAGLKSDLDEAVRLLKEAMELIKVVVYGERFSVGKIDALEQIVDDFLQRINKQP